ncbi:hypothetical protein N665_0492s0001 [Sinapis alba]|nr:hypothetical protein N665_0492s0001 [Sinapis alba]
MKVLSWNCRGMGSFQPHFGFDNLATVDPIGTSGGLALYFNNEYQVNILYTSSRMIDVEAIALGKKNYMTFVYGEPVHKLRDQVWEHLTRFGLARSEPWFFIGDLNDITGNHEKEGGALRSAGSFLSFNNMIMNTGLLEYPARGNQMSWQGRRNKVMVRCRLDRSLANKDWHALFPCSYTEYLGMEGSDHRPVVAYLENTTIRRRGQFHFEKDGLDTTDYWNRLRERASKSTGRGDLNTKFYHALTKQRHARNRIVGLYDTGGNWIIEEQGVETVAVNYFNELFETTSPSEFEGFLSEISPTITAQMNQRLVRVATEDEVQQALFMMHPEKAPRPDIMKALFPILLAYNEKGFIGNG